jgi:multidrug efflux pump subunit AcrB
VQLPDAASVQRTEQAMARIEDLARRTPGVKHTVAISGQSLLLGANASNFGSMYVMLDDFDQRRKPELSGPAIAEELRRRCQAGVLEALVTVFGPPPVDGLGTVGGFKMMVEDRGNLGPQALQQVSDELVQRGNATSGLQGLFTSSRADTPWLYLDIDRVKCESLGVSLQSVFQTLQVQLGSYYVNNFNEFGRSWQVNVQADARYRGRVDDIKQFKVRNAKGEPVPLGTLAAVKDISGPLLLLRYNMYASSAIYGSPAPGTSSGEAITKMDALAAQVLPDVNIFTQIGFVVLVGLASKNAILIVEFAKQQQEQGRPRREATLEACRLRLRPILMTSFAFILGVLPLVIAQGAGAEMRQALGLAVFSGMIGVTLFGIFLTPIFYSVIMWLGERMGTALVPPAPHAEAGVAKPADEVVRVEPIPPT